MIIVLGQFEMAAGHRPAFMRAAAGLIRVCRPAPGCLEYAFLADPADPHRVVLVERWATEDAFEAHRASGGTTGRLRDFAHPVASRTVRYEVHGSSAPRPFDA